MLNRSFEEVKTRMKKTLCQAVGVLMMVLAAVSWMAVSAETASAAADLSRQNASSDTATIRMSKTLTAVQQNKFPSITDFNFTLERVKAWDNSNITATVNGTVFAKSDIPLPAASSNANHTISVSGDKATVAIGNFSGSDSQDSATVKNRYTD